MSVEIKSWMDLAGRAQFHADASDFRVGVLWTELGADEGNGANDIGGFGGSDDGFGRAVCFAVSCVGCGLKLFIFHTMRDLLHRCVGGAVQAFGTCGCILQCRLELCGCDASDGIFLGISRLGGGMGLGTAIDGHVSDDGLFCGLACIMRNLGA